MLLEVLIALVAIVLGLVYLVYLKVWVGNARKYQRVDELPGPPKHWLYGTMHRTRKGAQNFLDHLELTKKYGGLVRLWRGPFFPIVVIYHANEAKDILRHSHPKSRQYGWVDNWLGTGLLTAPTAGGVWKRKRRMITPAFHFNILQRYVPVFGEHAQQLVNKWLAESKEGKAINICDNITTAALDMIGVCAFGYDFHALEQGRENHPYVKSVYCVTDAIYERAFKPWLYSNFTWERSALGKEYMKACDIIHAFADTAIAERRKLFTNPEAVDEILNSNRKLDFVDILLTSKGDDGELIGDREIRDECNTFIFEGHDTTSAGLGWTIYLVSKHPEVEKKALEEIKEVLGEKDVPDYEDMPKLKYVGQCIKEALRLYPSVPTIARYIEEDTMVGGKLVPAGTDVYLHPYVIHRQPDSWEDPEAYIPERHSPEASAKRDPFAFVPFSAGPRNCIGEKFAMMEMKTVVSVALKNIKFRVEPTHPVALYPALISRAEHGIKMYMEPRGPL